MRVPSRTTSIYVVGVVWDNYTPAVEAQLLKDILALQAEATKWPGTELQIACRSSAVDRLLAVLHVIRSSDLSDVNIWRTYQTGADRVHLPEDVTASYEQVSECVLYVPPKPNRNNLQVIKDDPGYALKQGGRDYGYNPFDKPPPSSDQMYSRDPLVNYVWTS